MKGNRVWVSSFLSTEHSVAKMTSSTWTLVWFGLILSFVEQSLEAQPRYPGFPPAPPGGSGGTAPGQASTEIQAGLLEAFNNRRQRDCGLPKLEIDQQLSADAIKCVNKLAVTDLKADDEDEHPSYINTCFPENGEDQLAYWFVTEETIVSGVKTEIHQKWINAEFIQYRGKYDPPNTNPGKRVYEAATRHFTQICWAKTTKVACASVPLKPTAPTTGTIAACLFSPPGNIVYGDPIRNQAFLQNSPYVWSSYSSINETEIEN